MFTKVQLYGTFAGDATIWNKKVTTECPIFLFHSYSRENLSGKYSFWANLPSKSSLKRVFREKIGHPGYDQKYRWTAVDLPLQVFHVSTGNRASKSAQSSKGFQHRTWKHMLNLFFLCSSSVCDSFLDTLWPVFSSLWGSMAIKESKLSCANGPLQVWRQTWLTWQT